MSYGKFICSCLSMCRSTVNDCSESKKRKKKLEKHQQMKKRKLNEKFIAVKQDHAAGQLAATGNINTLYFTVSV